MSRTFENRRPERPTERKYGLRAARFYGRARGISKAKAKLKRGVRHHMDHITRQSEDPIIEQPKKYKDFWWEWL